MSKTRGVAMLEMPTDMVWTVGIRPLGEYAGVENPLVVLAYAKMHDYPVSTPSHPEKDMKIDDLKSNSIKSGIDDMMEIVKQKQEQVEKKFWRVSIGDKDIVLRNYTTKIVGWLEKAGDIAVQFAPPQASLPWSLLKSIMQVSVVIFSSSSWLMWIYRSL